MTSHKRSCVTVTCDICGFTGHFEYKEDHAEELREYGWLYEDGQDFCGGCQSELNASVEAIKALAHLGRSK